MLSICVCSPRTRLWSICKSALSSLQLIVSYFHLGPIFGNQDHFVGLAIFVDTFRNDLQGMDVSKCVVLTGPSFSAGTVFGSSANFLGLAIFIDTYPNDEAPDVSWEM